MSGEWKPGDLILVPYTSRSVLMLVQDDGSAAAVDPDWSVSADSVQRFQNVRRLAVIDPEDRPAVERLYRIYASAPIDEGLRGSEFLAYALREYAANPKPPKPDEPTGLGAVVEDSDGERWVRAGDDHGGRANDNWRAVGGERVGWWSTYRDIDVVRVLSEGVQP